MVPRAFSLYMSLDLSSFNRVWHRRLLLRLLRATSFFSSCLLPFVQKGQFLDFSPQSLKNSPGNPIKYRIAGKFGKH